MTIVVKKKADEMVSHEATSETRHDMLGQTVIVMAVITVEAARQ